MERDLEWWKKKGRKVHWRERTGRLKSEASKECREKRPKTKLIYSIES